MDSDARTRSSRLIRSARGKTRLHFALPPGAFSSMSGLFAEALTLTPHMTQGPFSRLARNLHEACGNHTLARLAWAVPFSLTSHRTLSGPPRRNRRCPGTRIHTVAFTVGTGGFRRDRIPSAPQHRHVRLLFDDDLVEGVVQLCATGKRAGIPPLQIRRFHAERERCYQVLDPDERATAFARVHLTWFTEWGFERFLAATAARLPVLDGALAALAFRKARGQQDEGAELYADANSSRRGIVALRPERFADEPSLTRFLHHELAHISDIVDEGFGYSPDLGAAGQTASQLRLVRERYRLLWAVSIDGRLIQRGLETVTDEAGRRTEFDRGFAFLPEPRRTELFAALWDGRLAQHRELLELAADPRGLQGTTAPLPGAACPLCGFAAFQWTDAATLRPEARERIRTEFPGWQEVEPVCARCAEMYNAVAGLEYPKTVCL